LLCYVFWHIQKTGVLLDKQKSENCDNDREENEIEFKGQSGFSLGDFDVKQPDHALGNLDFNNAEAHTYVAAFVKKSRKSEKLFDHSLWF